MSKSRVAVNVHEGKLLGTVEEGLRGTYISFKGIPYAKPPVGDLRFKDPVPAESWSGERDASHYGNICVQYDIITDKIDGSEDCLYLNVFTTDIKPSKKRAVMVFLHPGGFQGGEGSFFGPDYIVPKEVVLVTLNHRLGALGFLNLHDTDATGNQGLKDILMALRWVRNNVSQFGGDPENVTLLGDGAGGAAVHLLALSPLSEGLFHKAISQGGVATNPSTLIEQSDCMMNKGLELAARLGKETSDLKVAYDFLKTVDANKLVQAQQKSFYTEDNIRRAFFAFTPSVDSTSSSPLFLEPIEHYMQRGVRIPFMLGFNSDAGIYFVDSKVAGHLTRNEFTKINADLKNAIHPNTLLEMAGIRMTVEELRSLYFGDKPVSEKTLSSYKDLCTDAMFIRGIMKVADVQARLKSPTYLYQFSHVSEKPTIIRALLEFKLPGAGDSEETAFLFSPEKDLLDKYALSLPLPGSNDYKMIEYMTTLWTNFSKTGNPTPATTKTTPVTWTPLKCECMTHVLDYLDINTNMQMKAFHKGSERWDWETKKNKLHD